jgi:hypothetical protein
MSSAGQPWWKMPTGPKRERAKRIKELRQGRWACRHWHWLNEYTRYFVGANGERYEFDVEDKDKQRAAREAARQSFDRILETL